MRHLFKLEDEQGPTECEWYTFLVGGPCNKIPIKVITFQCEDDYQMHWAHLCADHAEKGFKIAQENTPVEFCSRSY